MINELTIKGLKCFEEAEFHFKNLTLLAGKNSMGKSTVIQALLAMIQKGKNPFRGEYIDIGKISELKNKYVGSKEIEITVNQKIIRHMTLQLHWQRRQSMDVHYYRSSLKNIQIVC